MSNITSKPNGGRVLGARSCKYEERARWEQTVKKLDTFGIIYSQSKNSMK